MEMLGSFSCGCGTHQNDLRHTAVSSSDNPVLVDQGSPTEVESPTILGGRRCNNVSFASTKLHKGLKIEKLLWRVH